MTPEQMLQSLARLHAIMQRLRAPDGCPWDAEQTPQSLAPYLLEEAHEVLEVLDHGTPPQICDELGDLLLQIVFQAQIFSEQGAFDLGDVATAIADKLVRRHPHVFARDRHDDNADLVVQWERIKAAEKGEQHAPPPLEASLPRQLPALQRAQKLIEKSSRQGRAWPVATEVESNCRALLATFLAAPDDDNCGALLLAVVQRARLAGIDSEGALRRATKRALTPAEVP